MQTRLTRTRMTGLTALLCTAVLSAGCTDTDPGSGTGPSAPEESTASGPVEPEVHTFSPERNLLVLTTNGGERLGTFDKDTQEFVAYDATGRQLWTTTPRISDEHAFVHADRERVYVQDAADEKVRAFDWTSGEQLWEFETPDNPCGDGTMQLHSAGVVSADGLITGLMVRGVGEPDLCDFADLGAAGYAQAIDPVQGRPVGKPLDFAGDDVAAGTGFTGDGSGFLQYLSDGMSKELVRYGLQTGEAERVGLNEALAESDIEYGAEVEITETSPGTFDLYPLDPVDGTPEVFGYTITVASWAGNEVTGEGVIGGGDSDALTITSPAHARYVTGEVGAVGSPSQVFRLLNDGTGERGDAFHADPPDAEFYEHRNDGMEPRGLEDNVLPREGSRVPIAALPAPERAVSGFNAVTGEKLWSFTPEDGSYPIVEQAAPALGMFGIAGSAGGGAEGQKLFLVDASTGALVDTMDGVSTGVGSFFVTSAPDGELTVRGVTGIE
ncbi:PQQ-binding-like beta-propeller repeat protein [Brevibacterium luteolum]|uniref:outer membrane protein assembly factor BamB family protein n=1 Tax=Brevibacterium luteolum TaxID=199591 RepID=UPI003EF03852